jgi:uncharacterized protein
MSPPDSFSVAEPAGQATGETLVVGQSHFGMAGVTAVDYLVRHLDSTEVGHVDAEALPAIAPFEAGVPRHHSRLYDLDDSPVTVLVGELFVPVAAARAYTDAILEWVSDRPVEEILVLHGVPFPHGPEEHEVFYVATPEFVETRLADRPVQPLKGGVLDGVVGELVTRSLADTAPETGVFVTPTHPPGPDVDAALKLLAAIENLCDFDVDETELREFGDQLQQHYQQLADRMATIAESDEALGSRDYPEDRMYM